MARPKKNNCDYFSHDAGMRHHRKVKSLRQKFGLTGYAVWNMILELLTESDKNRIIYSEKEFELMSGDFNLPPENIKSIIDYCILIELFYQESSENGVIFYSKTLDERLAPVYDKRRRSKEFLEKQHRDNGRFCDRNDSGGNVSVTETPQSKVNENKAIAKGVPVNRVNELTNIRAGEKDEDLPF